MIKRIQNETEKFYEDLSIAFDHYNKSLFDNELPNPIMSIRAKANSAGYFSPERLKSVKRKKDIYHEIALNPVIFDRKTIEIFAVFVHEMVHLWQQVLGKPSKNGYHNKRWANKMIEIGLPSSNTGAPGGKSTGSRMSHYIEKGEAFEKATGELLKQHKFDFYFEVLNKKKKKIDSKIKYTCPRCHANAWGKPDLEIEHSPCNAQMEAG